jgi:UDP-N-acetylmuramoylalanine--D-glutamate ligase
VHPDFEDYVNAKKRIFLEQEEDDVLVLNLDNNITAGFAREARAKVKFFSRRESMKNGVFSRDGMIYFSRDYEVSSIIPETEILLPGVHNVENYMAAFAATEGLVSARVCRHVARTYGGVAHRL